jgi:hypothetical protein
MLWPVIPAQLVLSEVEGVGIQNHRCLGFELGSHGQIESPWRRGSIQTCPRNNQAAGVGECANIGNDVLTSTGLAYIPQRIIASVKRNRTDNPA